MSQILNGLGVGEVGLLLGPPNAGKTTFAFEVANRAAEGKYFKPLVPESSPHNATFVSMEDTPQHLQSLARRLCRNSKEALERLAVAFRQPDADVFNDERIIESCKGGLLVVDGIAGLVKPGLTKQVAAFAQSNQTAVLLVLTTIVGIDVGRLHPGATGLAAFARLVLSLEDEEDGQVVLRVTKSTGAAFGETVYKFTDSGLVPLRP